MKNKYFQESQDFQENFDEDSSENSDDALVAFLKQNKLTPPPPAPNFEQQLFAAISKEPKRSRLSQKNLVLKRLLPWAVAIPVAIATGLTFNWVTNRSSFQIANNASLNQMSEADKAEIEQSLISSWNINDSDISLTSSGSTVSNDTQLLMELSPLEYE